MKEVEAWREGERDGEERTLLSGCTRARKGGWEGGRGGGRGEGRRAYLASWLHAGQAAVKPFEHKNAGIGNGGCLLVGGIEGGLEGGREGGREGGKWV